MSRPPTTTTHKRRPKKRSTRSYRRGAMTCRALSEATGMSERQLARYFERGCPRDSAESVLKWKLENIRDKVDSPGTDNGTESSSNGESEPTNIPEARLQLLKKQAVREHELGKRYSLENRIRSGELVERAEIERDLSLVFGRLRDRLGGIGFMIANLMPTELKATCKATADEVVRVALKELADSIDA